MHSSPGDADRFDCRVSPYDPASYAALVMAEREATTRTVFATVFFGSNAGQAGRGGDMASGSSSGKLSIFNLDIILRRSRGRHDAVDALTGEGEEGGERGYDDDAYDDGDGGEVGPSLVVPAHTGAIYSAVLCGEAGEGNHQMLCTAGEDGKTLLWRVSDLIAATDEASASASGGGGWRRGRSGHHHHHHDEIVKKVKPAGQYVNPQETKARGALGPIPETTALAPDARRGVLLAAAGDGVCYGWDLNEGRQTPVTRLRGHADLLHCVASRAGANQAVTGSEDGTARIWDCRSEKCTQIIDVWRATEAAGGSGGGGASSSGSSGSGAWVGCVALDRAENWVAMGCGGRCITMWSFAAGACASRVATAAPPQALVLTGEHVMAAGAEPAVYRWNLAGQLISRQPCTPRSVYALDLKPRSLTAAGGTGARVDLFSELGTRVCTATCA